MNIMIGINDKYVFPARVMLCSFCENNRFEEHNIYILYDRENLKKNNIKQLQLLQQQYLVKIYPIEFDADIFASFPMSHHFSVETYFRFMAHEMLPKEVERVLWLDSDMIVIKEIRDFYYQDFENKSIVVCETPNPSSKDFLERLGLDRNVGYFNAGIILFNLNKIRKEINTQTYFECLDTIKDKIVWLDQDILNVVYANDKKLQDALKYNYTFFSEKQFAKEELDEIEENVCVLHYIGAEKPWHTTYKNLLIKQFRKYAKMQESLGETLRFECAYWLNLLRRRIRHI